MNRNQKKLSGLISETHRTETSWLDAREHILDGILEKHIRLK